MAKCNQLTLLLFKGLKD